MAFWSRTLWMSKLSYLRQGIYDSYSYQSLDITTLNILISEGGTNSRVTQNLAKCQGLKLLLNDTKFMTTLCSFTTDVTILMCVCV